MKNRGRGVSLQTAGLESQEAPVTCAIAHTSRRHEDVTASATSVLLSQWPLCCAFSGRQNQLLPLQPLPGAIENSRRLFVKQYKINGF